MIVAFALWPITVFASDDVSLEIRFPNGKSQYQVGETIPVELQFSATISSTYWITTRNYDRSGRLDIEHFEVNPPGRDPMKKYFRSGGSFGGGLGGRAVLKPEPYTFTRDLNEWVAIDEPGHYTLKVVSHRVGRGKDYFSTTPVPIESNELKFQIIEADPKWEQRTIEQAISQLEASNPDEKAQERAARSLRYLGTPSAIRASIHELGRNAKDNVQWHLMAGLFGARDSDFVVSALEHNMEDPDLAITADSIYALVQLQAPEPDSSKYPAKGTAEEKKAWTNARQKVNAKRGAAETAAYVRAAVLVPFKRGKARWETIRTLFYVPERPGSDETPAYTLVKDSDVAAAFMEWPEQEQERLLSMFGERFVSPAMGTALRKLLDSQDKDLSDQKGTLLRFQLLRILVKIDPKVSRRYIIGDIIKPRGNWWPNFEYFLLPDKTLPEIDGALGARIGATQFHFKDRDAQNIGRYATKAILSQVKAAYKTAKPWPECSFYDGLIAYFLKYERSLGLTEFEAMSTKFSSADLKLSMETIKELKLWPKIEPVIIARLDDLDPFRSGAAAWLLSANGGETAHQALLERLRRLHRENAGRKEVTSDNPAFVFEQSLVGALGGSPNWQLSDKEITEIEGLALAGVNKGIIAKNHWKSPVELEINGKINLFFLNHGPVDNPELLKKKVLNFPKGTGFVVKHLADDPESVIVLRMLEKVAGESGFVITVDSATQVN